MPTQSLLSAIAICSSPGLLANPRPRLLALRCNDQTVRNAIHAFNAHGMAAIQPGASRPHTDAPLFTTTRRERLRTLLHQRPSTFSKPTSVWTLALAAKVCFAQGITLHQVSDETIGNVLRALGVSWQRAKHWTSSPDLDYVRKNDTTN